MADYRDSIDRGRQAETEWPETSRAFEAVEKALLKELLQTAVGADGKVLKLHTALHNLAALRQAIEKTIRDGRNGQQYEQVADSAIAEAGLTRP